MSDRLDEAMLAVTLSFPMAADRTRAARILEKALFELVNNHVETDALGAPRKPLVIEFRYIEWGELRVAVKQVIREIGINAFAHSYGSASPQSLIDVVNRRKEPGVKTQARMLRLVTENIAAGQREAGIA
ncbi:hypothetical protein BMJ26_10930 [Sinorhizobium medicae]|uniref:hypothetical protein n=1 Tax=Sinorhizobium medicae TaxID=110321 RepID=UPI000C7CDA84|nr:hypothetical protein [Sinorhizobium medicae]PLU28323.1 hypothetical protein BMJ28_28830 [Sinorhizobium medicae]PLU39378.1 hypothetical protein BMJ26_10930 [Sinorhizobium medicae]PLU54669.1 hypothetical protein BMJ24_22290 [Sinorhizobium medicae]PLU72004.1 hypothetical protein BMJ20_07815 [Sinorhizobium medicae]